MLKMVTIIAIAFTFLNNTYASNEGSAGVVRSIRGKVFKLVPTTGIKRKKIMLVKGMGVLEGDIIATERDAYVELEMADNTALSLAPSSSFVIKKFQYIPGIKRITHYHQSWGKLRAKVRNPTRENESIQFNTKHVAVGVKDSEFLSNSYSINEQPTNDLLLLKGRVNVNVDQLNLKTKNFELKEGVLFNSNLLIEKGHRAFPRISQHFLNLLEHTRDFFLPRAQASNGRYKDINNALRIKSLQRNFLNSNIVDRFSPKLSGKNSLQSKAD